MSFSNIRPATLDDATQLTELLVSCANAMQQQGMHHWVGVYDEQAVIQNLNNKQVFVLEKDKKIVGCIALGTEAADYYQVCWPEAPSADYYITQLAVCPDAQGQGHGKTLVQYCINKIGRAQLQLDAVDHYPALVAFYLRLGFKIIATGIGLGDKRHLFLYTQ
jgi:ribosomal protein S18 acetylase RimI-like enzyme